MAVRRFRLVSLAAFVAALSINTAFAQVNIIPDLPICDSNLSIDGGDDSHQANPATNAVTAGVIVQAFESLDQSAFAEVKRTFTPILSLPVTLTYGPLTYFGELQGEQLKAAPKGFDKEHPSIDLLRYKQLILVHNFKDSEVLHKDFSSQVAQGFKNMRPFMDCMSELLTTDLNGVSLVS